jgi:hypothetical protein
MFPGVITPVPPLNTAVKLELVPEEIEVALAAKLVIVGVVPPPPPPVFTLPPPQPARLNKAIPAHTIPACDMTNRFMALQRSTENG